MQKTLVCSLLVSGICGLALLSYGEDSLGTIKGTVQNEKGDLIGGAKVNADPADTKVRASPLIFVQTDEHGDFTIEHLPWGQYRLFAMKEQDGYPNTRFALYSPRSLPTVTLKPDSPSAEVRIIIGPKAGALHIESIKDSGSGQNLEAVAGITLRRVDDRSIFFNTSASDDRILIPSGTDIDVEIDADGYAAWPPKNEPQRGRIRVQPEQRVNLKVELQPLPGVRSEVERIVRRASDANRLVMANHKVVGPFPPPRADVERLRELGDAGINSIETYLSPGANPLEQRGVLSLLFAVGGERCLDLIGEFAVKSQDPQIRVQAVKALAKSARAKDLMLLETIKSRDPDPSVRTAASNLLQR